jgi:RNA polymerase sigma-70 factor (ECF subfamily)
MRNSQIQPEIEAHVVEVFRELNIPLFWYLRSIGLRPEESEEIVQEAFLRLIRHLGEKGDRGQVRRWVFRVAHNLAIDQHRRQRRFALKSPQEWVELGNLLQDLGANPEEQLLEEEQIATFGRALGTLTGRQAQCLDLRMEGLSYREIGDLLGVTASTVAGSVGQAILKLRES